MSQIFDIVEELEKERKKNKELEDKTNKQKEILDKIKEYCETERVNILTNFEYLETTDLDNILKLLEEIE